VFADPEQDADLFQAIDALLGYHYSLKNAPMLITP
jgi:hypothetical protein